MEAVYKLFWETDPIFNRSSTNDDLWRL